jgi:hypothetical protein
MLMLRRLCLVVFVLMASQVAQAQLLFSLNPAGVTGAPGSSVTFNATLTNAGSDTIWLNGDNANVPTPGLTIDDTPYLTNFPLFLIGGDAVTADLFTVAIDPSVQPGDYFGSFTILGGADANAQAVLATQSFAVSIASASVPEPGACALLGSFGLTGAALLRRRLTR